MHIGLGLGRGILREVMRNLDDCCCSLVPYDLDETDDEYILTVAMPGHDAKDIEVSVKGNHVLIEATKKEEEKKEETPDAKQPRRLVSTGDLFWNRPRVEVKVPLEDEIDPENIKAKLDRGILSVRFKKKPKAKIPVDG